MADGLITANAEQTNALADDYLRYVQETVTDELAVQREQRTFGTKENVLHKVVFPHEANFKKGLNSYEQTGEDTYAVYSIRDGVKTKAFDVTISETAEGKFEVIQSASNGNFRREITTNADGTYDDLQYNADTGKLLNHVSGIETSELYKANKLEMPVEEYVEILSKAEAYAATKHLINDGQMFAVDTPNGVQYTSDIEQAMNLGGDVTSFTASNLQDSSTIAMYMSLAGGESVPRVRYSEDSEATAKFLQDAEDMDSFLSSTPELIEYQNAAPSLLFGDIAEAALEAGIKRGEIAGKIAILYMIGDWAEAGIEGTMLLAASEGYVAAETIRTIYDVYELYQAYQNVSSLVESVESGDYSGIITSEYFNTGLSEMNIDSEIVDTIVSLNDVANDVQAFQSGDIKEQLAISGKYLPSLEGGYLQDLADSGDYDTLTYLNNLSLDLNLGDIDFSSIKGFDMEEFNLSSLELQDIQDSGFDYSSLDIDLSGLDINFEGLQLPEYNTQSSGEETISEEETVVAQEETTTQEDTATLEGEVDISLPEQAQQGRGKPIKEEDEGFEQTNIFQAKTEGTAELGLETPTVSVDPLALDMPSFVNPYDPTKKYDPLRSV